MDEDSKINVVWLRRDLRFDDNTAIQYAMKQGKPVLLIYIFDKELIINKSLNQLGLSFVYDQLQKLNNTLIQHHSSIYIENGNAYDVFIEIFKNFNIQNVLINREYEPYTIARDRKIEELCKENNVGFYSFKDHVIFEPNEILKNDGLPYLVYSSYKNKWLSQLSTLAFCDEPIDYKCFFKSFFSFPTKIQLNIEECSQHVKDYSFDHIHDYHLKRDFPWLDAGSYLGIYLRYGTLSIRKLVKKVIELNAVFLSELVWREFFIQIMYHYPHVVNGSFKKKYDFIKWDNNEDLFILWQNGQTGYPFVDAGMRELNETGYMHNRVRMVTASFLCKHLLIDWRWGEAYFASKLQDYEFASNDGNWQWIAGTGCDAVPYFRVFNPTTQHKKFDPESKYINKWIPEFNSFHYPQPIIDHSFARNRVISAYKAALK